MKGVEGGDHGDVGAVENSGEEIEIPENDTFSSSIIFAQPNGSRALTVGARAFFSSPLVRIPERRNLLRGVVRYVTIGLLYAKFC